MQTGISQHDEKNLPVQVLKSSIFEKKLLVPQNCFKSSVEVHGLTEEAVENESIQLFGSLYRVFQN